MTREQEARYWELREQMEREADVWYAMPFSEAQKRAYYNAEREFLAYCGELLEVIMEENNDVLKRLKNA